MSETQQINEKNEIELLCPRKTFMSVEGFSLKKFGSSGKRMNFGILFQIFMLAFGRNKCMKSLVLLECEQIFPLDIGESFSMISVIQLSSYNNISDILGSMASNLQSVEQISVFLNFDCKNAENALKLVN